MGAVLLLGCVTACGDGGGVDKSIVQAVSTENETVNAKKALEEKAAAAAKSKREAAAADEAALQAAIDSAAVAPPELPESLDVACQGVVEAYDTFMKSGSEKDALLWSDRRRHKMGERKTACLKVGNIRIAACEAVALANPPAALAEHVRKEAGRMLMERCHDKFGTS